MLLDLAAAMEFAVPHSAAAEYIRIAAKRESARFWIADRDGAAAAEIFCSLAGRPTMP